MAASSPAREDIEVFNTIKRDMIEKIMPFAEDKENFKKAVDGATKPIQLLMMVKALKSKQPGNNTLVKMYSELNKLPPDFKDKFFPVTVSAASYGKPPAMPDNRRRQQQELEARRASDAAARQQEANAALARQLEEEDVTAERRRIREEAQEEWERSPSYLDLNLNHVRHSNEIRVPHEHNANSLTLEKYKEGEEIVELVVVPDDHVYYFNKDALQAAWRAKGYPFNPLTNQPIKEFDRLWRYKVHLSDPTSAEWRDGTIHMGWGGRRATSLGRRRKSRRTKRNTRKN